NASKRLSGRFIKAVCVSSNPLQAAAYWVQSPAQPDCHPKETRCHRGNLVTSKSLDFLEKTLGDHSQSSTPAERKIASCGALRPPHFQGVQTKGTPQMIKNTVIAIVAAATLAGVAAPAFAEPNSAIGLDDFNGEESDQSSYDTAAQNILSRLRDKGVNANAVENWGGLVRAFGTLEAGRQIMQFFSPGTLEQVAL